MTSVFEFSVQLFISLSRHFNEVTIGRGCLKETASIIYDKTYMSAFAHACSMHTDVK